VRLPLCVRRLGRGPLRVARGSAWVVGACRRRSGWRDLNPRPLAPKASALPSCATPRGDVKCMRFARTDAVRLPRGGRARPVAGRWVRWWPRGRSSMAEPQSSKLMVRVRFPSPALSVPAQVSGIVGRSRGFPHLRQLDLAYRYRATSPPGPGRRLDRRRRRCPLPAPGFARLPSGLVGDPLVHPAGDLPVPLAGRVLVGQRGPHAGWPIRRIPGPRAADPGEGGVQRPRPASDNAASWFTKPSTWPTGTSCARLLVGSGPYGRV
jgi:hypothetical protein